MSNPVSIVNVSARVPSDLRDQYLAIVQERDPEYDLSKAIRRHMREVVAENERSAA